MSSRVAIVFLLAVLSACDRQSAAPAQANGAAPDAVTAAPDEVPAAPAAAPKGALDRSHRDEPALTVAFTAPDGTAVTLASFGGKPLLVNLWATWCAPCVAEMPTLDAAAARLAGKVRVIAVSQDMDGAAKVAPFFAARKFVALKPYLDPKLGLSLAYQANLPTTILFDSAGKEVWRRAGGTDWTGAGAQALIAEAR